MSRILDLADIQGNILRPYGRLGFPKARFICLHIGQAKAGRMLLATLMPRITTALRWDSKEAYPGQVMAAKPDVALNIAITFAGLTALDLPTATLAGMPPEFIDGMAKRAHILGDLHDPNRKENWDPIWQGSAGERRVHMLISLNAQMQADGTAVPALETVTAEIEALVAGSGGGLTLLAGHGPDGARYQDSSALLVPQPDGSLAPCNKEHFGYTDGIGDPVFIGQYDADAEAVEAIGGGKLLDDKSWAPLATGEFLLGHPDEGQELPVIPLPPELMRNGTFMAWRKLHQNTGSFQTYVASATPVYAAVSGMDAKYAGDLLKAKFVGRWQDGVPLMAVQDVDSWLKFDRTKANAAAYADFTYASDNTGQKCPIGAHLRRANTRDMLDPAGASSVLNNRRRILRRGLPYGATDNDDDGEHGIIFLAVCASLSRQFEFVQQQWMQYGLDFNLGNETCPVIGNHGPEAKLVIAADPNGSKPPFIAAGLPQLVETRGGEYFFIPSMTALRILAMGITDPT